MAEEEQKSTEQAPESGQEAAAEQKPVDPYAGMQVEEDDSLYHKRVEADREIRNATARGEKPKAEEAEEPDPVDDGTTKDATDKADSSDATEKEKEEQNSSKKGEDQKSAGDGLPKANEDDPRGVQERIDELTRKFNERDRQVIELESKLRAAEEKQAKSDDGEDTEQLAADQVTEYGFTLDPADPEPLEPDPDDEDDTRSFGEWMREHQKWISRNQTRYLSEKQASLAQNATEAQEQAALQEKMDIGRKAHADFDAVVGPVDSAIFTPEMREAIASSDSAAEVAYQLAMQPDEARRIAGLSVVGQIQEITRFEIGLTSPPGDNSNDNPAGSKADEKPTKPADTNKSGQQQKKKPSSAPPPIETLGGRENKSPDLSTMPQPEFDAHMAKKMADGD